MAGTLRRTSVALLIAAASAFGNLPGDAQMTASAPRSEIIDDSGTVVSANALKMRWRQFVPGRGFDNVVSGETLVNVRLATAPWLGQRARIYMALARGTGVDFRATWTSGGLLLPGMVASGERALVFSGVIRTPRLADTLTVALSADGRQLTVPLSLTFQFQIEADR